MAVELAAEMCNHGVRSEVFALGTAATGDAVDEMHLLSDTPRIRGASFVPIVMRLRRELRTRAPDVILAHGGQAALASVLAGYSLQIPVVWQRILEMPLSALRWPRKLLWKFAVRRVAAVIAITPRVAEEVRALGFRGLIQMEANHRRWARFADLVQSDFRVALRRELGVDRQTPVIGFVGHLVHQKRPELAIAVLHRIETADVRLVVVGGGPLRSVVQEAARTLGVEDRVTLLGHRSDVPEILAGLDALVITSESETMTGTAIEAQMAGCPVLSFQLDGVDSVVSEGVTGHIIPMDDVDRMAIAASELLANPARRTQMAHAARARGQLFSTEKAAERYADLLYRIANDKTVRPRVLFLMPNFGVGGAERAILMISQHATEGGFVPVVASLGPPRRKESETVLGDLRSLGIEVHDLGLHGRADRSPIALARGAIRLRRLCKSLRIDIIDSCLFEADLVARLAAVGTRVRQISHLVNTPYDDAVATHSRGRGRWRFRVVRFVDAITGRLTDRFVAITNAVADAAMLHLSTPRAKLAVVSRGVDLDRFHVRPLTRVATSPLRVVSVGRFVPQKDHRTGIAAIQSLRDAGVQVAYTIAGEGPLAAELQRAIDDAGLRHVVTLMPPTRDVVGLIGRHDVFCFPSLHEGLGNALIEAMACGRPVIVSDIAVLREVVGEAGIYFPPGNSTELAARLRDLAFWPSSRLADVGLQLRSRAEALFAAPLQSQRLGKIYMDVLINRHSDRRPSGPSEKFTDTSQADSVQS